MAYDNDLLVEIKQGNLKAFERFFQNSYMRLLNYANLFISERSVAEDILQEAFISIWDKRSSLSPSKSLEALIFTTVRNRCLNYLRDQQTLGQHLEQFKQSNLQHLVQYDFLGDEEETLEELLVHEMNLAIEHLPSKCKQVFTLNKLEGKKQKEIADELNLSIKAVEKHMSTAKSKIKLHLEKKYPELKLFILILIGI